MPTIWKVCSNQRETITGSVGRGDRQNRGIKSDVQPRDLGGSGSCPNHIREHRHAHPKKTEQALPETRRPSVGMLHASWFSFFRSFGCKAVLPIIADRLIDNCAAIDTFPGIEHQEKVRETFQHHQSFALWAIHDSFLPH